VAGQPGAAAGRASAAAGAASTAAASPRSAAARADIAEVTALLQAGELHAATTTLPLTDIARAHQLLEDRAIPGRIVLVP
jgi:NADPH:quinone reductase